MKLTYKCLKPKFFLMARRGRLLWLSLPVELSAHGVSFATSAFYMHLATSGKESASSSICAALGKMRVITEINWLDLWF